MKQIWVKAIPWNKELAIAALESGADAVVIEKGLSSEVKKLGLIKTVADDGDIKPGRDVFEVEVRSRRDEQKILALAPDKPVIIKTTDWTIIPLENIIAQRKNIFLEAASLEEARTAAGILEKGVDGIIITASCETDVRAIVAALQEQGDEVMLAEARITRILPLAMGDRVCIDTCTSMTKGQGMLIGNSSSGMFLVHSESVENPYVEPRPFRVNAGPVHAYVMVPGGRTRYLSELRSGDPVLIVSHDGSTETAVIGRVKIEKRPLVFIEAVAEDKPYTLILQNAETIRLTEAGGNYVSVVELKEGSRVLMFTEKAGRHFGMKVDETIQEK